MPEVPPTNLRLLCTTLRATLLGRDVDNDSEPSPSKKSKLCNGDANVDSAKFKSPLRTRRSPRKLGCNSPKLRAVHGSSQSQCRDPNSWDAAPDSVFHLLYRCLDLNPETRITAEQALQHPFIADQR